MKTIIRISVAAMLLAGAMPLDAVAAKKAAHASEEVKIGVAGYTYRKFTIDQTLADLQSMGVKYLSVKDFWLPLNATASEMDAFKAKCAEYDVNPYILGPIYMKTPEQVETAFAYARRYGATMFIGVPNYELLDLVIAKVKETGIKVAIHTHGPDKAAFPDIRKIVEMVGDPKIGVGCCMDLGHSFRFGQDPAKDIVKYKDWIYDIHIKDETEPSKAGKTWEMGRGQMDIPAIVKSLRKIGYNGVVSLEFEKNGAAPLQGVAESIGYFRGVLDASK